MKWFYKWLKNRLDDSLYADDSGPVLSANSSKRRPRLTSSNDIDSDNGLTITLRTAIGGKIVTFRHYDSRTDCHTHKLYIIPEELDFERELGKMITLESMRG
jgi:hypothetical protein